MTSGPQEDPALSQMEWISCPKLVYKFIFLIVMLEFILIHYLMLAEDSI